MHTAIAVVFRHLLSFRAKHNYRLPDSPRQRLAADLVRILATPRDNWHFQVPPGTGLMSALRDLFQLYAAVNFFYTGKSTRLHIAGQNLPASSVPWLEIYPAAKNDATIVINNTGTLACCLPDLPSRRCHNYNQEEYFLTPDLISWLIQRLWNFRSLREGQYEVISRLARGQNTLGILPTGAGKSLCFQLPAMLLPGITLVVSPLKSLMRDQYINLRDSGITGAEFIDSSKTPAEKDEVLKKLRSGQLKMLYLSPERLQIESFQQELSETMAACPVSLFAIDEAHCISEWGHDFRPSYLRLRHYITQLHCPPVCALTATASHYVRQDILTLLGLNPQDTITPRTMDRSEISLQVRIINQEDDYHQAIANTIRTEVTTVLGRTLEKIHQDGAGVVFTPYAAPRGRNTRPLGTEAVARSLTDQGLDCQYYHSQMPDRRRIEIQDQFKDNAFPLLIATKGYGMGIDKENIDYVIHACAPASLEAYYQEAGRSGRDGEHAHSVIIARPRQEKCVKETKTALPACHRGWRCEFTGRDKCDYGIQAGLLALEYPSEQETAQRFTLFLEKITEYAQNGETFRYVCSARDSARQQKYLYYLQVLGAVREFKVLEYRRVEEGQFDVLLQVELAGPDSLANKYWLANKVVERIETYKAQKLNMLNTVQLYINSKTCRRRFLMQYFGDDVRYQRCNFCDIEGISVRAAPVPDRTLRHQRAMRLLEQALIEQDLSLALELAEQARILAVQDDVTVRSMRELEDRPHNPAALFLAGIFSALHPETEAYGIRNLVGAIDSALTEPQHLSAIFAQLTREQPDTAYSLARRYLNRLEPHTLQELAAMLDPPDQYPDVHLALLLPQMKQINELLKTEVPGNE